MQRSNEDLTLPGPGECMFLHAGAQDNGPEANLLESAPSKCGRAPAQNKDQEKHLPALDNCKPIQANSQNNGPDSDSCSGLGISMAASPVPSSADKYSKNEDNGNNSHSMWAKLGAMKCKQCGLLTSDAAVLNAHSCLQRNHQTSKLRESTACGSLPSHLSFPHSAKVGSRSSGARLVFANRLSNQKVQRPTNFRKRQKPLSSSPSSLSDVRNVSNKPVVPLSSTNIIEKQPDAALDTSLPCVSKANFGIVKHSPVSGSYTCQVCSFSAVDALFLEHLLTHMTRLPYSCIHCALKYKTRIHIRKHYDRKHPGLPAKSALNGVRVARNVMLKAKRFGKAAFSLQFNKPIKVQENEFSKDGTCIYLVLEQSAESSGSALPSCTGTPTTALCISVEPSVNNLTATDSETLSSDLLKCPLPLHLRLPLGNMISDGCSGQTDLIAKTADPSLASNPAVAESDSSSRSHEGKDLSGSIEEQQPSEPTALSQDGVSVSSSITGSGMQEKCERSEKQGSMEEEEKTSDLQISALQGNYLQHFDVEQEVCEAQASQSCAPSQLSICSLVQNHRDQDPGTPALAVSSCHSNYTENNLTRDQPEILASSSCALEGVQFATSQEIVGVPKFPMFFPQSPNDALVLKASSMPRNHPQTFPTLPQAMVVQQPLGRTSAFPLVCGHNADRSQQVTGFASLSQVPTYPQREVYPFLTQPTQTKKRCIPSIIRSRSPSGPATVSTGTTGPATAVRGGILGLPLVVSTGSTWPATTVSAEATRPATAVSTGVIEYPAVVRTGPIYTPAAVSTGSTRPVSTVSTGSTRPSSTVSTGSTRPASTVSTGSTRPASTVSTRPAATLSSGGIGYPVFFNTGPIHTPADVSTGSIRTVTGVNNEATRPAKGVSTGFIRLPVVVSTGPMPTPAGVCAKPTRPLGFNPVNVQSTSQNQHQLANCSVTGVSSYQGAGIIQPFAVTQFQNNLFVYRAPWTPSLEGNQTAGQIPQPSREAEGISVTNTFSQSSDFAVAPQRNVATSTLIAPCSVVNVTRLQGVTTVQDGNCITNHVSNTRVIDTQHHGTSVRGSCTTFTASSFSHTELWVPTASDFSSVSLANPLLANSLSATASTSQSTSTPAMGQQTVRETDSTTVTASAACASLSSAVTSTVTPVSGFSSSGNHGLQISVSSSSRSLPSIKKEQPEPQASSEASLASVSCDTLVTPRTATSFSELSASTLNPSLSAVEPRSYMMWNDQFVCLLCRKRFKDKQEFYSHVWNHQHPDNKKCPLCGALDGDPVCHRTDETIRDIVSKVNMIDACILSRVGNPQILEKILKILIPGESTDRIQHGPEVTERESPQHPQASSPLNDTQLVAVSASSAEQTELMASNTEISGVENIGNRVCTTNVSSTISVAPALDSISLLNTEIAPICATNAADVLGIGESETTDQIGKECVSSKDADDACMTMVSLDHTINEAQSEMASENAGSFLDSAEAACEENLGSVEVENAAMTSKTAQQDVTRASTNSAVDATVCDSEVLTALSESSAEMIPRIEDAAQTLGEVPAHDSVADMTNTVTKNCRGVGKHLVCIGNRTDMPVAKSVNTCNIEAAHVSFRNDDYSEDTLESVMPDDRPSDVEFTKNDCSISKTVHDPCDPGNTEKRESHTATTQGDASHSCPESICKHPTEEGASSTVQTVLQCPSEASNYDARGADESGLADAENTHPVDPRQGADSILEEYEVRCTLHNFVAKMGTKEKASWLLEKEDEKSTDEEIVLLNEENMTSSSQKTCSVLKTDITESNYQANGGIVEAVRECELTTVTSCTREIQYCGQEASSEPQINDLESAQSKKHLKSSETETQCDVQEVSSNASSSRHPGSDADMEGHRDLGAAGDDANYEACSQRKESLQDHLQDSEQAGPLAGKKADNSSSPVTERLSMFYICSMCPFSCSLAVDFTMHLNSCHDDEVHFDCYYCHYRGNYTTDLTNHITEHTFSRMVYRCPVSSCIFGAESIRQLEQHVKTHADLTECWKCAAYFSSPSDLLSHFKEHSMTLFNCSRCPARFLSKAAIMHHCQQDHAGRNLFQVLGMCLCHERKENRNKSFISDCSKPTKPKSEAMVEAATRCQDVPQIDLTTVGINSTEHGSGLQETSKLSKLNDSVNGKVHYSEVSTSPRGENSLRVRMENVNRIKSLMLEVGLPVKQRETNKAISSVTSPGAAAVAREELSLFHPMVSAPDVAASDVHAPQVDVPGSKQSDVPLFINCHSDKAADSYLKEASYQMLRETLVKEDGFCGGAVIQSSTSEKLMLISEKSDSVFPESASPKQAFDTIFSESTSPNQATDVPDCGVEQAQNSDIACCDSPLGRSTFPPAVTGADSPVKLSDPNTQVLTHRTDLADLSRSASTHSLPTALGSIVTSSHALSACGGCLSPTAKHSPPKKRAPTAKRKWSALLDFCGTDELDRAMRDVLYTQVGPSFRCYYCDRLISSLEKVHCHLFHHNKIPLTACLHCKKTGSSRTSVLQHARQQHPALEQNVNLLNVNTMFIAKLTSQPLTLSRFTNICRILKKPDIDYLEEHSSCAESIREGTSAPDAFCPSVSTAGDSRGLLSRQKINREPLSEDPQSKKSKADVSSLSRKSWIDWPHGKSKDLLTNTAVVKCEDDDNVGQSGPAARSLSIEIESSKDEETLEKIILNSPHLNKCLSPLFIHARGNDRGSVYTCQMCSGDVTQFPSRYKIHRHILEHLEVRPVHCHYCTFTALEEHDVSLHIRLCHQGKPKKLKHVSINLQKIVRDFLEKSKEGKYSMLGAKDVLPKNGDCRKMKATTEKGPHSLKRAKKGYALVKFGGWSKLKCRACGHITLNPSSMKRHVLSCTRAQKASIPVSAASKTDQLSENTKSVLPAGLVPRPPPSHLVNIDIQLRKKAAPDAEMVQYKCRLCSFQGDKVQMEEHIRTEHHKVHNKLFKCGHCNALYGNTVQLKNHTRFLHPTLPLKEEPLSGTMCYMEVLASQASRSAHELKPQNSWHCDSSSHKAHIEEVRDVEPKILDSDSDDEPVIRKPKRITKIKAKSLLAQLGSDGSSDDDFEIISASGFTQSPGRKQAAASCRSSVSSGKMVAQLILDSSSDDDLEIISTSGFTQSLGRKQAAASRKSSVSPGKMVADNSSGDDFEIISASGFSQSPGRKQAISHHSSSLSSGKVLSVSFHKSALTSESEDSRLTSHLHKRRHLTKDPVAGHAPGTFCTTTPTPEKKKTTFYRCGHCLQIFSSKEKTVEHNKAKHPTQLLSLEVHQHPEAEVKMSFPEEPKIEPFPIETKIKIEPDNPDSEFPAQVKAEFQNIKPDPAEVWIETPEKQFIDCPNSIQCILCSTLFSCHNDFKVHVDEIHSDGTNKQHWYDVHSKGTYDDQGGVVSPPPKVVVHRYLCAYCPTRGLHMQIMTHHHQEQHKDEPTRIIELQTSSNSATASEGQQAVTPHSGVKTEDVAAEPARKKVKYETCDRKLAVVLMNVFTLDPPELRNLLETNGVSALNMGCLPHESFLEILKVKDAEETCGESEG